MLILYIMYSLYGSIFPVPCFLFLYLGTTFDLDYSFTVLLPKLRSLAMSDIFRSVIHHVSYHTPPLIAQQVISLSMCLKWGNFNECLQYYSCAGSFLSHFVVNHGDPSLPPSVHILLNSTVSFINKGKERNILLNIILSYVDTILFLFIIYSTVYPVSYPIV